MNPVHSEVWESALWGLGQNSWFILVSIEKSRIQYSNAPTLGFSDLPTKRRIWDPNWSMIPAAKSLQSCPTLCDPTDGSPPGSPVPGILQARTLEWVAISFSKAWKWKVKVKSLSRVRLLATPWTAAHQAPPSMGFSRPEYWSGVPSPSPSVPASCCCCCC